MESAVKVFEEIEKIRRGCEAKLTHLARNRLCLSCNREFMPKRYEPCPECGSRNTRLMRTTRKCLDCKHTWRPTELGVCVWCDSSLSREKPKDDLYMREVVIPRLRGEEDFYEGQMTAMIKTYPMWDPWAKDVKGVGLTSLGRILAKCDITRLNTVSEMWAHCGFGLDTEGKIQRKHAGQTINYNPQLQSNCVMLGQSLMMAKGSYYEYYLRQKEVHSGLLTAHCHNRSFRHMIKLFLSHLWQVWREEMGLPAPPPYVFGILNHPSGHLITPWDMVKKPISMR